MTWLGLDIGGANLKVADGRGFARSVAFPLWQQPSNLAAKLKDVLASAPLADSLAVTMTGELADCFATKAEGVCSICDAVDEAAGGREVRIYLTDGRFVDCPTVRAEPLPAAASNWHALATYSTRYLADHSGLLIDVGSTTCDIIPLSPHGPLTRGTTDPERLLSGELVYTGVERSPICAIIRHARWREQDCPIAQEVFATASDAYVMNGFLSEDASNAETADGRPRTKQFAHARLARTVCADTTMFSAQDARLVADAVYRAQLDMLLQATEQVIQHMAIKPKAVLLSGHGEFLARAVAERLQLSEKAVSLTEFLTHAVSRSACAHALAVLAQERLGP